MMPAAHASMSSMASRPKCGMRIPFPNGAHAGIYRTRSSTGIPTTPQGSRVSSRLRSPSPRRPRPSSRPWYSGHGRAGRSCAFPRWSTRAGSSNGSRKGAPRAMSKKNVADVLVDTLAARGVERIYGVAGDSLNGITDAIRRQEHMRWAHVRHEETAAFAAGAEAHLTGRLAVCAGSCGPGNLHLINGLYDCHRSRVPVLAIAAQIPSAEIGGGYFQETHP